MNELTDSRGKYIFDIEFENGWSYRVAGNDIKEALAAIEEGCQYYRLYKNEPYFGEYEIKAKVRTGDFENFNEFDYDI